MPRFHERLRALRLEKGYTQAELAKAIGVTKSTMAKYDRGDLEPNIENIKKIAQALDVSIDILLGNDKAALGMFAMTVLSYRVIAVKHGLVSEKDIEGMSIADIHKIIFDKMEDEATEDSVKLKLLTEIAIVISDLGSRMFAKGNVFEKMNEELKLQSEHSEK